MPTVRPPPTPGNAQRKLVRALLAVAPLVLALVTFSGFQATRPPRRILAETPNRLVEAGDADHRNPHEPTSTQLITQPFDRSTIRGSVRGPSGAQIPHATVCLVELGQQTPPTHCVLSDSAGQFALDHESSPTGKLLATAAGYVSKSQDFEASRALGVNRYITIALDFGAADVAGTIRDVLGGPIEGATVYLGGAAGAIGAVALSGPDGSFALGSPPGLAELCAQADAYARVCKQVAAPSESNSISLVPESTIIGRVVMATTGAGVSGAHVSAMNRNGLRAPPKNAYTSLEGTFEITGVPAGKYEILQLPITCGAGQVGLPLERAKRRAWLSCSRRRRQH